MIKNTDENLDSLLTSNLSAESLEACISELDDCISELDKNNNVARALVYCTTEPDEKQLEGIKKFVCKEKNTDKTDIEIIRDDTLIGGFIIQIDNKKYDFSLK